MKNKTGKILLLILLICSSCSSIYRFSIDVQEPAAVTLPLSAQNVLILDNTVIQPKEYEIERTFNGQLLRTDYPLSLDSMVWSATDEIVDVLNDSHFFKTVAIYKKSLREDAEWLSIKGISPEMQSDFYGGIYNTLLVIDRLLFSVKEDVKKMPSYSSELSVGFVDMRTDGIIACSMYVDGEKNPIAAFSISDSLFVKSIVEGDSTFFFKEIPEFMLSELSRTLGSRAAMCFIPTWNTVDRMFFKGFNSRMQEAAGYAANRKWADAESLWINELGKKTNSVDKAKIAYNLATANEMQDKLETALRWAQNAKDYLKNADPNKNSQETELTDKYIAELERRIQNNRLLDLQWGKE